MRFNALAQVYSRLVICAAAAVVLSGCITPSEKRGMKDDIFSVQTRLLNLERLLADTSKDAKSSGDSATRRIASTQSELERLSREMQQVHGDIDALKVGVATGSMPGVDSATQEHSVGATMTKLSLRLDAIEASQQELLDVIKKAGQKGAGAKKKDSKALADADELQKAYDHRRYKQVVEDAPKLTKGGAAKDRETARFLLASSQFKLGNFQDAALKFSDFLESKPTGKYLAEAKLRLGDCFHRLGDNATAQVYYAEVVKEYPTSQEAAKANDHIAEMAATKSSAQH